MHLTLHLTTACNFNCRYCYSPPRSRGLDMSRDVIAQSLKFVTQNFSSNIGIIFFGGEPLLKKNLIEYTIEKCKIMERQKHYPTHFHYKVTTNGSLLDNDFLDFCKYTGLNIGLSVDGIKEAHNANRKLQNGDDTFHLIDQKIDSLLTYQPGANALMVVTPVNVKFYSRSVKYLIDRGFRYIVASLNFAATWSDKDLKELERQYQQIAMLYKKWTVEDRKFYFSPFETKLANHIRSNEDDTCSCQLSTKQISIAPGGKIYPCVQFVKDGVSNTQYSIGDVWNGFNEKRETLFKESVTEKETCKQCLLKKRCYNTCSCLNWQTTGNINTVSPLLCETERILIPIVDKLGAELHKMKLPMFVQKQYSVFLSHFA